jgi:hypothetical protein
MQVRNSSTHEIIEVKTATQLRADKEAAEVVLQKADAAWDMDMASLDSFEQWLAAMKDLVEVTRELEDVEHTEEVARRLAVLERELKLAQVSILPIRLDAQIVEISPWGSDPRVREMAIRSEEESDAAAWSESNR